MTPPGGGHTPQPDPGSRKLETGKAKTPGTANAETNALGVCEFGPDGCDPEAEDESLFCKVCDRYVCDYHGDYPTDAHYADGEWRCPDCQGVE